MTSEATGLTTQVGWQAGVRRTLPAPIEETWRFLLGEGLPAWLGTTDLQPTVGATYHTTDEITGTVRSIQERRRIRLTWRPTGTTTRRCS